MIDIKKIPVLFFDGRGHCPEESELWVERHEPKRPDLGDTLFFGLRIANIGFASRKSVAAGGYMLTPEDAAALYEQLGEALARGGK